MTKFFGKIALLVRAAVPAGRPVAAQSSTDWTPRESEIDFSFLPEGEFAMTSYRNGVNADRFAGDYKMEKSTVHRAMKQKIKLAPAVDSQRGLLHRLRRNNLEWTRATWEI